MKYYPINLNIQNRDCLVVGGGAVATRKVEGLLACEARVTVVSPEVSRRLMVLSEDKTIQLKQRGYKGPSDMEDTFMVIGATDDRDLNHRIYQDAEALGRLCNIADQPDLCNFILPSVVRRGDLILAISTSGKSPAFAKHLRKMMEAQYGDEYETFLQLMGAIRRKLVSSDHNPEAHKEKFAQLIEQDLIDLIRSQNYDAVNALLAKILGEDYNFQSLTKS